MQRLADFSAAPDLQLLCSGSGCCCSEAILQMQGFEFSVRKQGRTRFAAFGRPSLLLSCTFCAPALRDGGRVAAQVERASKAEAVAMEKMRAFEEKRRIAEQV